MPAHCKNYFVQYCRNNQTLLPEKLPFVAVEDLNEYYEQDFYIQLSDSQLSQQNPREPLSPAFSDEEGLISAFSQLDGEGLSFYDDDSEHSSEHDDSESSDNEEHRERLDQIILQEAELLRRGESQNQSYPSVSDEESSSSNDGISYEDQNHSSNESGNDQDDKSYDDNSDSH